MKSPTSLTKPLRCLSHNQLNISKNGSTIGAMTLSQIDWNKAIVLVANSPMLSIRGCPCSFHRSTKIPLKSAHALVINSIVGEIASFHIELNTPDTPWITGSPHFFIPLDISVQNKVHKVDILVKSVVTSPSILLHVICRLVHKSTASVDQ